MSAMRKRKNVNNISIDSQKKNALHFFFYSLDKIIVGKDMYF